MVYLIMRNSMVPITAFSSEPVAKEVVKRLNSNGSKASKKNYSVVEVPITPWSGVVCSEVDELVRQVRLAEAKLDRVKAISYVSRKLTAFQRTLVAEAVRDGLWPESEVGFCGDEDEEED